MYLVQLFCDDEQILQTPSDNQTPKVPHISECNQHTILVLIPCIFLCIFLPIILYALHKAKNGPLKKTGPISFRIFFCGVLIADVGILLAYGLYESTIRGINIPSYNIYGPGLLLTCLILVLNLLTACRNHGLVASGVLFNFWLLLTVCGFPEFRHKLDVFLYGEETATFDTTRLILYIIYYLIVILELVLACFADVPQNIQINKKTCPELFVSFLNNITFWWFTPLATIGNQRPLVMDDLWDLNDRDRSRHLLPKFEKIWKKYLANFYKSSKNQPQQKEKVGDKIKLEQNGHAKDTDKLQDHPTENEESGKTKKKKKEKEKPVPSIIWPLFKAFQWPFLGGGMYKLIFDLLQFVSPQLLSALISFIEDKKKPLWMGVSIALAMFCTALVQSMILHQYFHTMFRTGMYIRQVLTSLVYKKALFLSNTARKNRTVGEIVNIMSVDIQRFQDATFFLNLFWSSPLQVLLAIFFLYKILGVSVFAGLIVLFGLIPINSVISSKMRNCQTEQMKFKDERIKLMSDVLNGIKILKLYAWEASIQKQILDIRKKELKVLKKIAYLQSTMTLMWSCAPFLVAVSTFGVYVTIDPENNVLTPHITFVALSLFNILRFPLAVFGMVFGMTIQLQVSNKRMKTFLAEDEIQEIPKDTTAPDDVIVSMKHGSFSWDSNNAETLHDINLNIPKGALVAIVGRIGAGKSSLLSALLGEMHRNDGYVSLRGSVAYVPQQAWIQNLTLKQNVLFNREFDEKLYAKVLDACCLTTDLETLPAGDATEIGEKGINLSGGQKHRVSLARALYSESDIYLLDDPLAAVDAHVGKSIFENVISSQTGLLKNKTRVFITHGLHFLKHCDQIIVIKDGKISESGTYMGLIKSSGDFSEILEEFLMEEAKNRGRSTSVGEEDVEEVLADLEKVDPTKKDHFKRQISQLSDIVSIDRTAPSTVRPDTKLPAYDRSISTISRDNPKNDMDSKIKMSLKAIDEDANENGGKNGEKAKLIEIEGVETGKVKFIVYMTYIRAIGCKIATTFLIVYIMGSMMGIGSNLWLANWSDRAKEIQMRNDSQASETHLRLGVYTALGLGQALFIAFAAIIMALGMVYASSILHENMLANILRSPMSFFDVTPIGRILNRFSKDVDGVDAAIPRSMISFVQTAIASIEILIVIAWATPAFLFAIGPLAFIYLAVLRFYVSTSRQLKRLESTSRSPIYSHFQESIQGASSIRAYDCTERFLLESQNRVDNNLLSYYPSIVSNRWLAVRLELVGNLIVLSSALSAALFRDNGGITAGLVGLAVSYALNITQTLNWAVRMTSELETNIVAVERIKEYSETPTESELDTHPSVNLPKEWPTKGVVDFENLQIRYRPDLDLVLKGLTAHVHGEEKVGIIGRTGAGKSSLTLALFRIVEPAGGTIFIDNFDITKIGLYDLRSRLTIVPQDPVLFTGSLRMNLDPFDRYDDSKIWHVLRLTHMDTFVETLPERLQHTITEGGENLSVGQRQLICLARALLRKSKILVLDEAAASVDMETDQLIQRTIKEQFADCTVLTIAHRLHSVIESDRLMVLDTGNIREFDSPKNLLENKHSLFHSMALDAGLVSK